MLSVYRLSVILWSQRFSEPTHALPGMILWIPRRDKGFKGCFLFRERHSIIRVYLRIYYIILYYIIIIIPGPADLVSNSTVFISFSLRCIWLLPSSIESQPPTTCTRRGLTTFGWYGLPV